jgi:hypothetical protein
MSFNALCTFTFTFEKEFPVFKGPGDLHDVRYSNKKVCYICRMSDFFLSILSYLLLYFYVICRMSYVVCLLMLILYSIYSIYSIYSLCLLMLYICDKKRVGTLYQPSLIIYVLNQTFLY